jgi:hypothetical protein
VPALPLLALVFPPPNILGAIQEPPVSYIDHRIAYESHDTNADEQRLHPAISLMACVAIGCAIWASIIWAAFQL